MDLQLKNKVALVTAASQGLGLATARSLAREGAHVVISARHREALESAAAEIAADSGATVQTIVCDLTQPAQIESMVQAVIARHGTIHILINNAGGPPPGAHDHIKDQDWQRAFDLTLMSAVRTTRAVLPHMRQQRWGRVVNISSFSIKQPIADILLSNSLRLGVAGWAKTLANEVAADNVLINTVCPGWTRTKRVTQMMASRASAGEKNAQDMEAQITSVIPLARLAEPEEIADAVVFLASQRASYITGAVLAVDGGVIQSPT